MENPVIIPNRGAFVYACFKWILIAYRGESRTYAYQSELIDNLQYLNVRHLIGYLEVDEKSLPLLQYSIGVLDGYLLENYFAKWRSTTRDIVSFRQRSVWRHIQRVFYRWSYHAKALKHCRIAFIQVVMRRRRKLLRNTLETWWGQKRLVDLDAYCSYRLCKRLFYVFRESTRELHMQHQHNAFAHLYQRTRTLHHCIQLWRTFKQRDRVAWRSIDIVNVRRCWRKWHLQNRYNRQLHNVASYIHRVDTRKRTHAYFGSWLVLTLHRLRLKRCANQLIIRHFQTQLSGSFQQWRRAYICSVSQRRDHLLRLQIQAREFEMNVLVFQRLSLERWKITCFRAWRLLARVLKGARRLQHTLSRSWYRNNLLRSFRHWIVSCSLATIAACVQKLWRGYAVRILHHANIVQHLRWFSVRIGASLRYYNRMLQTRMFLRWANFYYSRATSHRNMSIGADHQRRLNKWHRYTDLLLHQRASLQRGVAKHLLYIHILAIRRLYLPVYLRQLRYQAAHFCVRRQCILAVKVWKRQCLFSVMVRRHEESQMRSCISKWRRHAWISTALRRRLQNHELHAAGEWFRTLRMWSGQSRVRRDTLSFDLTLQCLQHQRGFANLRKFVTMSRDAAICNSMADKHGAKRLQRRYFPVLVRNLRQRIANSAYLYFKNTSSRKMRHRQSLRRYLRIWRHWNYLQQRMQLCRRRLSLHDVFQRWILVYDHQQRLNRKVHLFRTKCMRRLVKGIYLIWKLYTIRHRRIHRIRNIIQMNRNMHLKREMLYKWREALERQVIANVTRMLSRRSAMRTKRSVFTLWFYAARKSQMLSWRSTAIVFRAWARLARDNNITRRSLIVAEVFSYKYNMRYVMRCLLHVSLSQQRYRYAVQRCSALMLIWRARQCLKRWIRRCWWLGYRVYRGRLRLLVPHSLTWNYLLVRGRTPQAHEAMGKRCIRRWRRWAIAEKMQVRVYLYRKYFFGWKRGAHSVRFKRFAFIHRLQVVLRKQMLLRVFKAIASSAQWSQCVALRAREVEELRLRRTFDHIKRVYRSRLLYYRNQSIMTSWIQQTTRANVTSQLGLYFRYWRVRCGVLGSAWRHGEHVSRAKAFRSWKCLLQARRQYNRTLLMRCVAGWRIRVVQLRETRSKLLHFRHAAMTVEASLVKVIMRRLHTAFNRWTAHTGHSQNDDLTEWRSKVNAIRSSRSPMRCTSRIPLMSSFHPTERENSTRRSPSDFRISALLSSKSTPPRRVISTPESVAGRKGLLRSPSTVDSKDRSRMSVRDLMH